MTAEVAVMNKGAVALAADSAVTIGRGGKIYTTVNKIFTLSKFHPIGIMIYGNANYMGVPFETVIKTFRRSLGTESRATVKHYADDFLSYLGGTVFQRKEAISQAFQSIASSKLEMVGKTVEASLKRALSANSRVTTKFMNQIAETVAADALAALEKAKFYGDFESINIPKFTRKYKEEISHAVNGAFPYAPPKKIRDILKQIAVLAVLKDEISSSSSGIVFAGFGNNEMFPHVIQYETDGIVEKTLKMQRKNKKICDRPDSVSVIPFAQRDMVTRFMEGVDPRYLQYLTVNLTRLLKNFGKELVNKYVPEEQKADVHKAVDEFSTKIHQDFSDKAGEYRHEHFVQPILDVLVSSPKEELANFAEALINLVSVKRRMSAELETVGGPIDVAVISKGDGFIWIKRKFYFDAKLNPYFLENYFSGGGKINGQA